MATYTLTANSNYSAIKGSLANNDTIDCAGFELTIDEQSLLTWIAVTTPGTVGTILSEGTGGGSVLHPLYATGRR